MNKLLNFIAKERYNLFDLCVVSLGTTFLLKGQILTSIIVCIVGAALSIFLANINSKTKEE